MTGTGTPTSSHLDRSAAEWRDPCISSLGAAASVRGFMLQLFVQLVAHHLVRSRRRMPRVVVEVRRGVGAGRGVLMKDLAPRTGIGRVDDAILRVVRHHIVIERSPMAKQY